MRAVITGATGHVGINLVHALLDAGHDVRALVHERSDALRGVGAVTMRSDMARPALLTEAFRDRDVVFHVAGRISITRRDAAAVEAVNVVGTRNVIAACITAGVRRLVSFSSIEAIEHRPLETPVDEGRPPVDPAWGSPYAVSKARAEQEVLAANGPRLETVVLNPTAIIGPRDFRPSLLGRAVVLFARGRIPALVDGGFDWVDVRDVAAAAVAAAARGAPGSRYIIGGRWASMGELAALVCGAAGRRPPRLVVPLGLARAWAPISTSAALAAGREPLFTPTTLRVLGGNRSVSHARAARDLGYAPRDLAVTIRDTLDWFAAQGLLWKHARKPGYSAPGGSRE
jgi:dihydroflavonol-4-reductase